MPGIVGIISSNNINKKIKELAIMLDCMKHESNYSSGSYVNEHMRLCAGWVCHKGSFSDNLPIFNERKDIVLIFTGEVFTDRYILNDLITKGHEFNLSDSSYLVHLYEEEGREFFKKLNGWFAGILIDLRFGKAYLFNDRYPMQRIYYHLAKEAVYFSSEAKAILNVKNELRKIDNEGFGQLIACGCTLGNRSIFSEISLVPGGSLWTFQGSFIPKKDQYFKQNEWEIQSFLDKETLYQKLNETLRAVLPRYLVAITPIALSLTGGLDTRMILANANLSESALPCYTFGGIYRDCFDIRVSREIASICRQKHTTLRLEKDYFSQFPFLAEKTVYITDGTLEAGRSYELYLNRLAKEIAPIRLTGKYGGEVLRSITSTFKPSPPVESVFDPEFRKYIKVATDALKCTRNGNALSFAVFKQIPWRMHGCLSLEQSQLTLRSPYMDNDLVSLMYRASQDVRTSKELSIRLIKDNDPSLFKIMTDNGYAGDKNIANLLQRIFRIATFKAEWYYNLGMPDVIGRLDYAMQGISPGRLIMGYHKIDHNRIWFRNNLSQYIKDILIDEKTKNRPYLNGSALELMVKDHLQGRRNYTHEINVLLTIELIQRLLIERS